MQNQDDWSSIIEIHSCLSVEISKQLALTDDRWHLRRAILKKLLNEIEDMDALVDCVVPSVENYLFVCGEFFSWLDNLKLSAFMIEKIQERFGADHFFIREILPKIKVCTVRSAPTLKQVTVPCVRDEISESFSDPKRRD